MTNNEKNLIMDALFKCKESIINSFDKCNNELQGYYENIITLEEETINHIN